jgi:hypothetical protein
MIERSQIEHHIATNVSISANALGKKHFISFERDTDISQNQRLKVTMRDNRSKVTHQNCFMLSEQNVKDDEVGVILSSINHFLGNLNQYVK